ncbi:MULTISPECIES: hypothetical protein [unclassified Nocardioides]|uniref:hypothetical protein n=1 Tax=unclassified Nocardioides TaxID=2615069 RepID=UPI0012E381FD|nr:MULTISPECIES: hypothetical protein [unclassified Nocardioides]
MAAVEPSVTLVPVDDEGGFLVFGQLPESLQMGVEPVPYLGDNQVRDLADALASSAGVGNLLAQGWNAYQGSAGLVRLAPQTLAALKAGATPLTQGGWALGTLTKGGKFAAQVRWAPAGAAGVAAGLAALGPALALVAVQWQMNKVGKAVERNIELTRTVLDDLREEAWYELDAVARVVLAEVRAAQVIGEVTDLTWQYLQAQSTLPVLLKHRQRNRDAVTRKLGELSVGANKSEWYQRHYADVLRHSQAVMTAQQAITLHHLVRAAHARRSGEPLDDRLAKHVLDEARRDHELVARHVDESLRALHQAMALWYEASPGKRLPLFGAKDVPLLDLRDAVADLHARAVAGPFRHLSLIDQQRTLGISQCVQVPDGDRPSIQQRLRWVLADDESVLLLAKGIYKFGNDESRHLLVVTEHRALMVDSKDLKAGRATVVELPAAGEMTRTLKDGHELVELQEGGKSGVLKTRAADSVIYNALTELRARLAATPAASAVLEQA